MISECSSDVIGIVIFKSPMHQLPEQVDKNRTNYLDLYIVDETKTGVVLTLWGPRAMQANNITVPSIIAVTNCRVKDLKNMKILKTTPSSYVFVSNETCLNNIFLYCFAIIESFFLLINFNFKKFLLF